MWQWIVDSVSVLSGNEWIAAGIIAWIILAILIFFGSDEYPPIDP